MTCPGRKTTNQLIVRLFVWLCLEVILTLLNLDNLADYSEFLNKDQSFTSTQLSSLIQV